MATLVLTVVGGSIGGPIGAAIGSIIGQQIDRNILFKPKGREGPRLTDLSVQTSSYGTPIPKIFGTMRVAGSVIWSTDLIETKAKSSSGKGQPTVTNYSYAASFAVLLSARSVQSVGRIWADGKLLRGASGDFKTPTGFRLYHGSEDQSADPLIASAEGSAHTPAIRGSAYVVFENFQLADYGNRIPSLTFEVVADSGPVAVGDIAAAISGGIVMSQPGSSRLIGYSAYGDSVTGALETLALPDGAWFAPFGRQLMMRHQPEPVHVVADEGFAPAGAKTGRGARRKRSIAAIETVPQTLAIAHYDAERDYQTSVQRARRPGAGTRTERVDLPAVVAAATAKQIAQATLARRESARGRRSIALGWDAIAMMPGDGVTIAEGTTAFGGQWRIDGWSLEAMVLTLELVRLSDAILTIDSASGGRVAGSADTEHGPTLVQIFEVPGLDDTVATAPRLMIAANGAAPGWRRAALLLSTDGGARYAGLGRTALPAVIGTTVNALAPGSAALIDRVNYVDINLCRADLELDNADDAALCAGGNAALVGDELIQFAKAEPLGDSCWRLSGLWRGRRGTEAAMATHEPNDRFVLLSPDALVTVDVPLGTIGGTAIVLASGVGDIPDAAQASTLIDGASLRPPSPVHVHAARMADGALMLRWVRRSRAGWRWIDGVDAPLAEERELYRVSVGVDAARPAVFESALPELVIGATDSPTGAVIAIRQVGTAGESLPASIVLID